MSMFDYYMAMFPDDEAYAPDINLPAANHAELTMWLIENAHARNWQTVAEKLLRDFAIYKRNLVGK